MHNRLTFLSHFVLCLAIAAGAWFAWLNDAPQAVYAADASHVTSALALMFVGMVAWIGWQAWRVDSADSAFAHLAILVMPLVGVFGTAFGISLELKAKATGADILPLLGTALYCTATAALLTAVIALLTHNLDQGIKRARPERSEGARR
jgi:hypothetical protein